MFSGPLSYREFRETGPGTKLLLFESYWRRKLCLFYFVTNIPAIKSAFQHANNQLTCKSLL